MYRQETININKNGKYLSNLELYDKKTFWNLSIHND